MKYAYLTFDCYGTLIDWRAGIETALRSVLGDTGLGRDELLRRYVSAEQEEEKVYKKYRQVMENSIKSVSKDLGLAIDGGAARRFASSLPTWPAFPDSAEFLRETGRRGYRRYILSNVDKDLLRETLSNARLSVDGSVTAEDVTSYKPEENHWLEFMRRTGARRDQILHVAQSVYHDIVPTQRLGIASAWINRYGERFPKDASASIVSDDLAYLEDLLS